jgi:hypothetical protein
MNFILGLICCLIALILLALIVFVWSPHQNVISIEAYMVKIFLKKEYGKRQKHKEKDEIPTEASPDNEV